MPAWAIHTFPAFPKLVVPARWPLCANVFSSPALRNPCRPLSPTWWTRLCTPSLLPSTTATSITPTAFSDDSLFTQRIMAPSLLLLLPFPPACLPYHTHALTYNYCFCLIF
ncbi:unnamed protein product [Schistocephalus solidus]|uniref:Uncharacterized protein n=1 Tax=Schistocephalus solidus TaxID=70667 RepID=A0A3P7DQZ9_SCHSO|nr:unnamed protein product [Schistocephalus solidus]